MARTGNGKTASKLMLIRWLAKPAFVVLLAGLSLARQTATPVFAGSDFTLHPAGRGQDTYASWKGQEGLPDSNGSSNSALYFQYNATNTHGGPRGQAYIRGFKGMAVSALYNLEWWNCYTSANNCLPTTFTPGNPTARCTPSDAVPDVPRWEIQVKVGSTLDTVSLFCGDGAHSGFATASNGMEYIHRTFGDLATALNTQFGVSDGTIQSVAIVMDEPGFAFLDCVTVNNHVWTFGGDNGNGQSTTCPDPTVPFTPITNLTPLTVDDATVLTDLNTYYPADPLDVLNWQLLNGL